MIYMMRPYQVSGNL